MTIKNISGVARHFSLIESCPRLEPDETLELTAPSAKALAKVRQYVINELLEVTTPVTLAEMNLDNLGIASDVSLTSDSKVLTATV